MRVFVCYYDRMNLIFIYGPPASGKLTVAEEIAKLSGYKLFHNHLTQDLVRELYPEFNELRFKLVDKIRLDIFEYTAENDTNLIFTYVYSGDEEDDAFITETVKVVHRAGGNVLFIELTAPNATLLERVANESRQRFHKLKDSKILQKQLEADQYNKSILYSGILKIDTSLSAPIDTARSIMRHYQL